MTEAQTGRTHLQSEEHREPPEVEEAGKDPPLEPSEGWCPAGTLITGFQLPALGEKKFLLS